MNSYNYEVKVLSQYMIDNNIRYIVINGNYMFSIIDICKHLKIRKSVPEDIITIDNSYPKSKTKMKFIDQDNLYRFIYLYVPDKASNIITYIEKHEEGKLQQLYIMEVNYIVRNLWNIKSVSTTSYLNYINAELRSVLTNEFCSANYDFITKSSMCMMINKSKVLTVDDMNTPELRNYIKILLKNDLKNSITDLYHSVYTINMNPEYCIN